MKSEGQLALSGDLLHTILTRDPPPAAPSQPEAAPTATAKFWSCIPLPPNTLSRDGVLYQRSRAGVALPREESGSVALPREESGCVALPREESSSVALPREESGCVALPREEPSCVALPREEPGCVALPRKEPGCVALPREEPGSVALPREESGCVALPREDPGCVAGPQEDPAMSRPPPGTPRVSRVRRSGCDGAPTPSTPHQSTTRSTAPTPATIGHTSSSSTVWQQVWSAPTWTQLYLVLATVSVAAYVNGLTGEYVHDDVSVVVRNPDVQGTTPLWQLFLNDYWGRPMADPASHKSYRPLTILTFRFSRWVCGNSSSLADHSVNLALHSGVTLLYARTLIACLSLTPAEALASGLIFATHPVHTEAVTGVVGRADLLAAGTFLASFTCYHRSLTASSNGEERAWVWWAGLWACVGVLCKEHALTVLGVCVAWDLVLSGAILKRCIQGRIEPCVAIPVWRRIGKIFCLGLLVAMLRLAIMKSSPVFSNQDNPASFTKSSLTRLLTYLYLPAHNTWLLVYPSSLAHDWQMGSIPLVSTVSDLRNAASIALYGSLALLWLLTTLRASRRDRQAVTWSLLVLCLSFLPASNALFTVGFVVAERLLYIPSLGWCTVVGVGVVRAARVVPGRLVKTFLLVVLIVFCVKTTRRNLDWRSREALFTSGLRTLPHNAKNHYNYANFLRDVNKEEQAVFHYREAIRLWWSYPSAHNNLGTLLLQRHQQQEAERHFQVALSTHPRHPRAAFNLASLWRQQGRIPQAILLLESTFRPQEDEQEDLGRLLADLYLQDGRMKDAEGVFLSLAADHPTNPTVLTDYAALLNKLGRTEAAARHYEAALSLDPAHTAALTRYAALMSAHHHHTHAHRLYSRALACNWDPDTATALARLCLLTGQLDQANTLLARVTDHHPGHLAARVHMAQVRLQQKHYLASEELLQGVLQDSPKHREALYHLSLLYSATNRSQDAVEAASTAARACSHPRGVCALLHAHHADLLHTLSLMDDAVLSYQLAVTMEPAFSRAHLNLGAIYHTQGRYSLALDHYHTALTHDPTNTLLLENLEKLRRAMKTKVQGR